jgi:hypothetical protein
MVKGAYTPRVRAISPILLTLFSALAGVGVVEAVHTFQASGTATGVMDGPPHNTGLIGEALRPACQDSQ